MTTTTTTTVRAEGLRVRLGRGRRARTVLDGVDLDLGHGVHGLLGPNGAGKTTLVRVLATLVDPDDGHLHLLGRRPGRESDRREVRRRLGYLPQTFGGYPRFSVREFVEYFAWLKEVPAARAPLAVDHALDRVGLADRADSRLKELSGGMVRRVGLAQALVNDPELLLLDEPTAGLDPEQRVDFRRLVRDLSADTTVVLSTHLVEDVAAACDEVTLLDAGRVAWTGTPTALADLGGDARADVSAVEHGYTAALRAHREGR
ncbi:ABC transporter ATP-binding protein [Kineococcus rhizosphaerae]|uniref:ABC-2 type transport system ATP-binding protein n=1 Tax=Kineococcus rhizosphaerae TaxID=559628 RepID=A0A2T0QYM3_9ACTN|nr:ABC transporter ATP-binding protein [Kineococcus rhizosphaerae]PRY11477.1 ABC-2 type transport system ATP-binding protein [Kineococcus rhizosphaerae]